MAVWIISEPPIDNANTSTMAVSKNIPVSKLSLDLKNYRTTPQKKELDAVKAMLSIKPDRFLAIIESILEDGYMPTENIIVLKNGTDNIVKEGNRRIAALKIIYGHIKSDSLSLPQNILDEIKRVTTKWKADNAEVPCLVFASSEADVVDKVVSRAHGKQEKASKDPWNSVAKARHNRDVNAAVESGLDMLEKYLKHGTNLNQHQKERWSGDFPVSLLDETLRKIAERLDSSVVDLVRRYPKIPKITEVESVLLNIGLEVFQFKHLRDPITDYLVEYGIPSKVIVTTPDSMNPQPSIVSDAEVPGAPSSAESTTKSQTPTTPPNSSTPKPTIDPPAQPPAFATSDPRSVAATLKNFSIKGHRRAKVAQLLLELKALKIKNNPIAFCFILRSMFEISAKVYCDEIGFPTFEMKNGSQKDKKLVTLLQAVTDDLTSNKTNIGKVRALTGAYTELNKTDGILSITSMNQLVHHTSFTTSPADVCTVFGNIFPLLEHMN
jgi:hypothetical protein